MNFSKRYQVRALSVKEEDKGKISWGHGRGKWLSVGWAADVILNTREGQSTVFRLRPHDH